MLPNGRKRAAHIMAMYAMAFGHGPDNRPQRWIMGVGNIGKEVMLDLVI